MLKRQYLFAVTYDVHCAMGIVHGIYWKLNALHAIIWNSVTLLDYYCMSKSPCPFFIVLVSHINKNELSFFLLLIPELVDIQNTEWLRTKENWWPHKKRKSFLSPNLLIILTVLQSLVLNIPYQFSFRFFICYITVYKA